MRDVSSLYERCGGSLNKLNKNIEKKTRTIIMNINCLDRLNKCENTRFAKLYENAKLPEKMEAIRKVVKIVLYSKVYSIRKKFSDAVPKLFIFGSGSDFVNNFGSDSGSDSGSASSYSYILPLKTVLYYCNRGRN